MLDANWTRTEDETNGLRYVHTSGAYIRHRAFADRWHGVTGIDKYGAEITIQGKGGRCAYFHTAEAAVKALEKAGVLVTPAGSSNPSTEQQAMDYEDALEDAQRDANASGLTFVVYTLPEGGEYACCAEHSWPERKRQKFVRLKTVRPATHAR